MDRRIVTLTTDFGTDDHYVGTMKGVVLNINPDAAIVDVCHAVSSYDLLDGALTIVSAYAYFPEDSVHVVVVDPGVGSNRRAIIADTGRHVFVAPDNGVLTLVYDREPQARLRQITNDRYFLHPVSNTFHGRDIFAPVAAHISRGVPLDAFGPEITDPMRLDVPRPRTLNHAAAIGDDKPVLEGSVLKIDKFGNIVTNVAAEHLAEAVGLGHPFRVRIADTKITLVSATYAGVPSGQPFLIFGSMGLLEIAMNRDSAAERLGVRRGDALEILV